MPYEERKRLIEEIEGIRGGRKLICFLNFDKASVPEVPGLITQFSSDVKEPLYRVLKETNVGGNGVDLFLYTRGGDTNSVWPIVSLLREFDAEFQVLIPFRAHSAGSLLTLASKRIIMTRIAELSPIDPSTGNQFNPLDPLVPGGRLGISVEDVNAYQNFVKEALGIRKATDNTEKELTEEERELLQPYITKLTTEIHPIALGNVHRVHKLIQALARKLLTCNVVNGRESGDVVRRLTVEPYSHLHMFNRSEAKDILGDRVEYADEPLDAALDALLRDYERTFGLREPLFLPKLMAQDREKDVIFVGAVAESANRSYLYRTRAKVVKFSKLPGNVNIQLPPGQAMPLIPGLPVEFSIELYGQAWEHNTNPEGVTL